MYIGNCLSNEPTKLYNDKQYIMTKLNHVFYLFPFACLSTNINI
jgi:hypothetical protein